MSMHAFFFHCEYSCTYMYILKHIISTLLFSKAVGPYTNCMLLCLLQQHEIHMYSICTFAQVLKKGIHVGIYLQFRTTGALKEVNYLLTSPPLNLHDHCIYMKLHRESSRHIHVSGRPSIEARHPTLVALPEQAMGMVAP